MPILYLSSSNIALIAIFSSLAVIILCFTLYWFIFRKRSYAKQAKDISKKFAYYDALLIGQDSQYIHRLEVISRSNLLYVEKYETFLRRYKTIYENYDKFAVSMIHQLDNYLSSKQYRNIKQVINEAKKAVNSLETEVERLTADLKVYVKLEDDARQSVLKLKEQYRQVKQNYFAVATDLESIAAPISQVFEKLDSSFAKIEQEIDTAEYDDVNAELPVIQKVISAIGHSVDVLPNLCSLLHSIIPNKLKDIMNHYLEIEKKGTPLYHLKFKNIFDKWNRDVDNLNKKISNLQVIGVNEECQRILDEISDFNIKLGKEVDDENYFKENSDKLYADVLELERNFLRISSLIPEIKKVYIIEKEKEQYIEDLRNDINHLIESRRILDGFVHSGTKQPFSKLKEKLSELQKDYNVSFNAVRDFKAYIDSLRSIAEESFKMLHSYFYRFKELESQIRDIGVPSFNKQYENEIESVYQMLDSLSLSLQDKPINVQNVKEQAESLKTFANSLIEEIEKKYHNARLAESAIVFANRDRNHQNDVDQQLTQLEILFEQGDFEKVYHDASAIYKRNHVEGSNEQSN